MNDRNESPAYGAVTVPQVDAAGGGGSGGGSLVAVEAQRAVAEVQARMMVARANPRNMERCIAQVEEDCSRLAVAEHAVYQYAKGGTDIEGPSIKLAEALARRYGNLASGIKELSRSQGVSECVAYAWDLESGYYDERQFPVRHWRDTKSGGYPLRDERDIAELVLNMGQRRKRSVLLTMLPADLVDHAVKLCEKTLKAKADTSPEAMVKMVDAFSEFGITRGQIEARIQRKLEAITAPQVVGLKKIYASLRDGISVAADHFDPPAPDAAPASTGPQQPMTAAQKARELVRAKVKGKAAAAAGKPPGEPTSPVAGPPAAAAAAASPPSSLPSAVELRQAMTVATDRASAMRVFDVAHHLDSDEYTSLVQLFEDRFPDNGDQDQQQDNQQ